jgi:two-component system chemotaxis sensor kinase CheA
MSDYFDPKNEELLKDFFAEAQGQIEILEQNLLVLENDPGNKDAIDELFRAAHTLKGGSATVQMSEISEFTHSIEDVLDSLRSAKRKITEKVIDSLLASVDTLKEMLEKRMSGQVFDDDIAPLISLLKASVNEPAKASREEKSAPTAEKKQDTQGLTEYELLELGQNSGPGEFIYKVDVELNELNTMNTVGGIQVFAILKNAGKVLKTLPGFEEIYSDTFFPEITYYVSTKETAAKIKNLCTINDVTTAVSVETVKGGAGASS